MTTATRERIVAIASGVLAVWLAFDLSSGSIFWPLLVGAAGLGLVFVRVAKLPLDAFLLGLLLFGYVVGNRGFAQFMPVPGLPLLPAEIGLATGVAFLGFRCARARTLPWRRDALNIALLIWIILGAARILFDVRQFGFVAIRDFATIYYVGFFFIAQELGRSEHVARFLVRCLFAAGVCLPIVLVLYEIVPDLFLSRLVVRGIPLIYLKGDLAPTFVASLAVMLFLGTRGRHRWWARPLATVMMVWVFGGDNRASMLGLAVALAWLAVSQYRAITFTQIAVLSAALAVIVAVATFTNNPWAERRLQSVADRAQSVVDLSGRFAYSSDQAVSKTDNNQFRWVWWRTVAADTMANSPALGLGFGYDLARGFLQEYNPELADDFSARSPHSIIMTILGRMGLVGLAVLLAIATLIAVRTWRVLRDPASDPIQAALWAALWPIAISACLGVVLEGPMGAVVFWSLLGLAESSRTKAVLPADDEEPAAEPAIASEAAR